MAEVLALGMTHYPGLLQPDADMAGVLRWVLADPDVPDSEKARSEWPAAMRDEYGTDDGMAAASRHRDACVRNFRRLRAELDSFRPDVIVIWGDDQYENFREEIIPQFCIFATEDLKLTPWADHPGENVWGEAADHIIPVIGAPEIAKSFASSLINEGIDLAYSYQLRDPTSLPHAFTNTLMFLDYDRQGFSYPVIPFQVNCYGSYVIAHQGRPTRFADSASEEHLDPPGPSPRRAMHVGAALARSAAASPWRVAIIGSSSWSHAFLHDKAWRLHPDVESDRRYFDALVAGDYGVWEQATTDELVESGQQEMLNWFCLVGAIQELGLAPAWTDFVPTYVFNSSKVFGVFRS